ncbi:SRPBCC domain-containing protein [Aurantiacibacter rhizosphaerae]|uniref:ATPase n=1 Tax=Aurantiacibacter rhizosphaerae TaxID=2691582 RepID=A0A844XDE0_9SPHN|nr:SRPBCC domain-containing protein [Aurantiacibacter rhizosphaerae]MWV27702.1 ATPase [Aurantiacibacter rhizosphaerae]
MKELSVTAFIEAAPETVWDTMVNRQEEWFCPAPWRCKVIEQDRRAGGVNRMVFLGPDGEEMPQEGIYLAWDEGRRLASTDAVVDDLQPAGPFMIGIWEIEPEGNGTRYTALARHWRDEDRKQHEEMGFIEGWQACATLLKSLCESE